MQLAIHRSWHGPLKEELSKEYVEELKLFLSYEESSGSVVYPPAPLVFNALSKTLFEDVRVVIVGQDPYHGPGQAHGLSFSVPEGITPPPSLKNIFKELQSDLGLALPTHGNLEKWARQGVLLLNATLTVRARMPRSHYGKGWERFTDAIIRVVAEKKDPVVFLLWGKSAQEKAENVLSKIEHPHLVLTAAHPSPYSATSFFGCKHFSKVNEFLKNSEKSPIDWSI